MKILLIIFFFFSISCNAQKIIWDKKDPFTNKRTLVTELMPIFGNGLGKIADVSGSIIVGDSIIILGFISPKFADIKSSTSDSVKKQCLIKLSNNEIVSGAWISTTDVISISIGAQQISNFSITKDELAKLISNDATDIKFVGDNNHGLQFEVTKKNKSNISKMITTLLKFF